MITAIVTLVGAIISGLVSLAVATIQHNKTSALMEYRLEQLEKKVDKHNNIVERMALVERDIKTAFSRIDEISNR